MAGAALGMGMRGGNPGTPPRRAAAAAPGPGVVVFRLPPAQPPGTCRRVRTWTGPAGRSHRRRLLPSRAQPRLASPLLASPPPALPAPLRRRRRRRSAIRSPPQPSRGSRCAAAAAGSVRACARPGHPAVRAPADVKAAPAPRGGAPRSAATAFMAGPAPLTAFCPFECSQKAVQ